MADRTLRTDWKRIGRSGITADGREIKPEWLNQIADSYDKSLFTALIWPEHQRYVNYGTVEALRTTDNEEGGIDLWAILSPNSIYQSSNSYGQKLFTSMEITFDFRKSGTAYLTGLGATDDPASIGTSEIRFSKLAEQAGVQLSAFVEAETKTFTDQQPETLLDQLKALFTHQSNEDANMADKKALEDLKAELGEIKTLFSKLAGSNAADDKQDDKQDDKNKPDPTAEAFKKLTDRLDALEANFAAKPEDKPAVDADALKALTDRFTALETKLNDALKQQPGTDGGEHFGNTESSVDYL